MNWTRAALRSIRGQPQRGPIAPVQGFAPHRSGTRVNSHLLFGKLCVPEHRAYRKKDEILAPTRAESKQSFDDVPRKEIEYDCSTLD